MMNSIRAVILLACLCALGTTASLAEFKSWKGKKVTRPCHAALDDPKGFMASFRAHKEALVGFKYKLKYGVYRVRRSRTGQSVTSRNYDRTLRSITKNLARLSRPTSNYSQRRAPPAMPTAALVYDIGLFDQKYSVCIWLITPEGIKAATTVPLPDVHLSGMLRDSFNITARAAARSPKQRRKRKGKGKKHDRTAIALASVAIPAAKALALASRTLLPAEISTHLENGKFDRLLILPAADISTLPFAGLQIDGRPLILYTAPVILADIDGLTGGIYPRFSMRRGTKLIIGDPDLSKDRKLLFSSLPGARDEALHVAEKLISKAIIGRAATRRSILQKLRRGNRLSLIYFATHGISDPVNPMDGSFLALRKGHLYARDIKKLKFEYHPTVVMSACQSGLGKVFEGGVFGLARAWHKAGASQVVTSLWNIDDEATSSLMKIFMSYVSFDIPPEIALQKAMFEQQLLTPDPALWASFSLFGLPYDPKTIIE